MIHIEHHSQSEYELMLKVSSDVIKSRNKRPYDDLPERYKGRNFVVLCEKCAQIFK